MHGRIISAAVAALLAFAGPAAAQTIEQGPSRITTDAGRARRGTTGSQR